METKKIPCEVYSRIVGYFRPIRNWNKGKRQEFVERKSYEVPQQVAKSS
jgi:anaerobic ribonucleoside-triphosphate reductase